VKHTVVSIILAIAIVPTLYAAAKSRKSDPNAAIALPSSADESNARVEGERRFRTNCGRCHQAPHKFPPRMMMTIERHMRVRALVTEEDMRLILHYMTQ
jgi:cytochrome c5